MRSSRSNIDHRFWHGYFTGPQDWNGLRVVSYVANQCPTPQGRGQKCNATGEYVGPLGALPASAANECKCWPMVERLLTSFHRL